MGDEFDSDSWAVDDRRLRLIEWLQAREGAYYRWGAKGEELPASAWQDVELEPPACRELYDCSGLAACAVLALGGPDWRATHTADRLFHELEPVPLLQAAPGDLAFYGQPDRCSHVMFIVDHGQVFGASGGNASTLTLETAHRVGARVRHRSSHLYRPDFRGARKFPFPPLKEIRDA
jgi:cell wall-associated NlpC family hydrolase